MNNTLLCLSILLFFACQNMVEHISILDYEVTPQLNENPSLEVNFSYQADAYGEIKLEYYQEFWGESSLYNCLDTVYTDVESTINILPDSNRVLIQVEPEQVVQISYRLIQDHSEKITNDYTYRPIIQPTYFHLFGHRLFLFPDNYFKEGEGKEVWIDWDIPDDQFIIHNSFGQTETQRLLLTKQELESSIFVGGDFKRFEKNINGNPIFFLTRGKWDKVKPDTAFSDLSNMIQIQRDFWRDHTDSLFTVTMIPTSEVWTDTSQRTSLGGTGLTQSFASFASYHEGVSNKMLIWLFAHELMHNWIGTKIQNEAEESQYWFSEGFTDYYAYKLRLKSGLSSLEDYIRDLNNRILKEHYTSPVNEEPNSKITTETFWTNRDYEKLPYRRGLIYALWLDTHIKQQDPRRSLDDMMRQILANAQEKGQLLNDSTFLAVLGDYPIEHAEAQHQRYILDGELIPLEELKVEGLIVQGGAVPQFILEADAELDEVAAFLKR